MAKLVFLSLVMAMSFGSLLAQETTADWIETLGTTDAAPMVTTDEPGTTDTAPVVTTDEPRTTSSGTTSSGNTSSGTTPLGTTPLGTTSSGTTPLGTTPSVTTPSGTTPLGTTPLGTTSLRTTPKVTTTHEPGTTSIATTPQVTTHEPVTTYSAPKVTTHEPGTTSSGTTSHVTTHEPAPTFPSNGPGASVSCDSTSMTVFLDRTLLENNGNADDVHFEDQSCVGYDYNAQSIAVITRYNECGTKSEQTNDVIKYSNVVTYLKPTGENGSVITRDFRLKIPVTCELNRRSLLGNSFKPKLGIVSFTETGYGNFSLSLSRFADASFTASPVDPQAEIYLGEKVYFGANLTAVTDLTLLLDRCWATPDVYPMNPTDYTVIVDGCVEDDTVVLHDHMGALMKGFSVDAFAFIGEYPEVYIHCDVLVCDNTDSSSRCAQGCMRRARRSAAGSRGASSKPHTVSNGPLSGHHSANSESDIKNSSWLSNPVNMMLVGAAGFFVAMVAMVTLRKVISRKKSAEGYHRLPTEDA